MYLAECVAEFSAGLAEHDDATARLIVGNICLVDMSTAITSEVSLGSVALNRCLSPSDRLCLRYRTHPRHNFARQPTDYMSAVECKLVSNSYSVHTNSLAVQVNLSSFSKIIETIFPPQRPRT